MKSYIFMGGLVIALAFSYLKIQNLKLENDNLSQSLNTALFTNKRLNESLNELKNRHELELQKLSESVSEKEVIKEKIEYVNRYIYKQVKAGENNITRLFNEMTKGLFNE